MWGPIFELDRRALFWINSHHYPVLDAVLAPISYAGEGAALWIVVSVALLVIGRPGYRRTAIMLLLTMIIVDRLIAAPLALAFQRERPYLALEGVRQVGLRWTGSSFPSGHADSVWPAAIILSSRWRRLTVPLIALSLLTCYSRPYFGMHYPLDVIAGSALGIAAGFAAIGIERWWRRRVSVKSR